MTFSAKTLSVLNLISTLLVIGVNGYVGANGFNGNTIGGLSGKYDNLFTPASYAFAIWSLIFLGILTYSIYQVAVSFSSKQTPPEIQQTGLWFLITNILNTAWVYVWLLEWTLLSVIIMIGMMLSLLKIILNTNMEKWDAPLSKIAFLWWPICIYAGWIAVALIANISALLSKIAWSPWLFDEVGWTVIMIIAAVLVNLFMIVSRNMREFAVVGVWALYAIYVRHEGSQEFVASSAFIGAISLAVAIAIHGFMNRKTNPFKQLFA